MSKAKALVGNYDFLLGVVSLVIFMGGGFYVCLLYSMRQLVHPFYTFIITPIPFGAAFAFLTYKLKFSVHQKSIWKSLAMIGIMTLTVIAYILFMLMLIQIETNWTI